jgi:Protein of unknown function (DUF4011)
MPEARPDRKQVGTIDPAQAELVRRGLENIRRRLLDLTNRNKLINFRHARSSLRIADVDLDSVYQSLLDEKKFPFVSRSLAGSTSPGLVRSLRRKTMPKKSDGRLVAIPLAVRLFIVYQEISDFRAAVPTIHDPHCVAMSTTRQQPVKFSAVKLDVRCHQLKTTRLYLLPRSRLMRTEHSGPAGITAVIAGFRHECSPSHTDADSF